jgi:hypothetical protein
MKMRILGQEAAVVRSSKWTTTVTACGKVAHVRQMAASDELDGAE